MTQDDSIAMLQKVFKYLLVACVALGVLGYVVKSNMPAYHTQTLPNQNVQVKYLSPKILDFFHQSYPDSPRRVIIYAPELEESSCPYLRDMAEAFKRVKNSTRWLAYYDIVPQMRTISKAPKTEENIRIFMEEICSNVCIADMQKNWVYSVPNASSLESALETFKNKN